MHKKRKAEQVAVAAASGEASMLDPSKPITERFESKDSCCLAQEKTCTRVHGARRLPSPEPQVATRPVGHPRRSRRAWPVAVAGWHPCNRS